MSDPPVRPEPVAVVQQLREGGPRRCPFDCASCGLKPADRCPVCGDIGTDEALEQLSRCVAMNWRTLRNQAADTIEALLKERDELQAAEAQHESALAAAWGRADSDRTLADFWARSAHTNKELREAAEAQRDALRTERDAMQAVSLEWERRYRSIYDIDLARLQLPDGTVPGGTEECARAWYHWAREFQRERDALRAQLAVRQETP
jgi:hypothetical protein